MLVCACQRETACLCVSESVRVSANGRRDSVEREREKQVQCVCLHAYVCVRERLCAQCVYVREGGSVCVTKTDTMVCV